MRRLLPSPRWRKALRDLWLNKARTLLVVLAIAIGIFGLGVVANAYTILMREMDVNYMRTNPASATLWTDPIDDEFVRAVRELPVIGDVEARRRVVGRVQVGPDEWKDIWLYVIDDFDNVRVNAFWREEGAWHPGKGEILLERVALSIANAEIGDTLTVKIPGGSAQSLRLAGTVHAPGLAPAWMEGFAYGFITRDGLERLGGNPTLDQLQIVVAQSTLDESHIRETAYELKDWIESQGRTVYRVAIPEPGKHPHASQMATLLFLLEAFGFLALILSGVLVANVISAMLSQQIRQIGVIKAVGGSTRQIAGLYLGVVLVLGLAALVLGLPLGVWAGRAYAAFTADLLNFVIFDASIPLWAYGLQIGVGLLVPLAVAAYPVYRGSRVTVRQALGDYGVGQGSFGEGAVDALLSRVRGLARPFLLSLRNTFRRRGRLALTLGTLAAGGAVFIVAMNVIASMNYSVASRFDAARYDIQVRFTRPYPVERIEQVLKETDGVAQAEGWGGAMAARVCTDGTTGNSFTLLAPPAATELLGEMNAVEGRWLESSGGNEVVINSQLLELEPGMRVGEEIVLKIGDEETVWRVVGLVQEMMALPTAYTTYEYLSEVTDLAGQAQGAVIVAQDRDIDSVSGVAQAAERSLQSAGLEIRTLSRIADLRQAVEDHLVVIAVLLVMMALLVVVVGGLGLISTMSINVLERRREIGVLRAIGASDGAILRIILIEGALIGVISWLIAIVLSPPLSGFVGSTLGMIFFESPLLFAVSPAGFVIWLAIVIVFSAAASFYPAWNAMWLTTREVLGYE